MPKEIIRVQISKQNIENRFIAIIPLQWHLTVTIASDNFKCKHNTSGYMGNHMNQSEEILVSMTWYNFCLVSKATESLGFQLP